MAQKIRLGDLLIECNIINDEQLGQALKYQKEQGLKLGEALIAMGLVSEDDIIWAIGNQLGISQINLTPDMVDPEVISIMTPEFAREYRIIPLYHAGKDLSVCMTDPLDTRPIEYLESKYNVNVLVSVCTSELFENTYAAIYGDGKDVSGAASEENAANLERGIPKGMEGPEKIVNYMLGQAIVNKADCIHTEPSEKGVVIRFRINNVLTRKMEVPLKVHNEVIVKLKSLAMINESSKKDDGIEVGFFRVKAGDRQINIQTVFFQTIGGEMVTIKLKDYDEFIARNLNSASKEAVKKLFASVIKNHGTLYITGPCEAGRTTTAYCLLRGFDPETRKIVTIEDPVSMSLPLTAQIQVDHSPERGPVHALRVAMMLDPDVIFVDNAEGEQLINDINFAAVGGKTVLASFRACDSGSAAVQICKSGADPVLIASAMCGIANQRLIRTLCPHCKKEAAIPAEIAELLPEADRNKKIYEAVGCDACGNTGYVGKTLLIEYLPASAKMRQLLRDCADYSAFKKLEDELGIKSNEVQALELVLKGEVSADEFLRLF